MKKAIRICLVAALCVVIVVSYYYYLSHKNDNASGEETVELTEVDKIIAKDFDQDYPSTPRGVVKWYNRIITAFYAEDYTDEELEEMADQIRLLLDDELLSYNSREDYLASLKTDIEDYKSRDKKILQSKVSDSSDVTYATVDGDYCAYVNAYYFAKEGNDYSRTYEEYVLRRDEEGRWKILAFQLTDGEDE
jgi:hypothetical protein